MIDDDRLRFLDDTWHPPTAGGRGGGKGIKPLLRAARGIALAAAGETPRAKLSRVTSGAPEVMVKVSGRQRGASHTLAHLDYISRHGKLDVETSDGERIESTVALARLAEEWVDQELRTTRRREPLTSVSMVMSMPPGHDPDRVYAAVRAFARVELERFPYAMALHTDTDHAHVHLTVAARGEGGARFNPRKDDLAQWREAFARELRARGIAAEATPRRARGKVQKFERTSVRKMSERAAEGRTDEPRVARAGRAEAARLAAEPVPAPKPWETQAVVRQGRIRADYLKAAQILAESEDPADRVLADRTRRFVEGFPEPATRTRRAAIDIARNRLLDGRTKKPTPRPREPDRER